jgi:hypothetical protein
VQNVRNICRKSKTNRSRHGSGWVSSTKGGKFVQFFWFRNILKMKMFTFQAPKYIYQVKLAWKWIVVCTLQVFRNTSLCYLQQERFKWNKMAYYVLTQLKFINFLVTCFGFYKINFRPMLTIGKYIQCVHTLRDPIVFT